MGPLIPLFWTGDDVSSRFQSQSGQPYSHLVEMYVLHIPRDSPGRDVCVTHPMRFTSSVTAAELLAARMAAKPFSSIYLQAGIDGT